MYILGARTFGARVQFLRCEQKGQWCKQEDASPKRAMFSRLGGSAPPKWFTVSLSLSLSLLAFSLEPCIKISSPCTLYLSCTLLGPCFLGMVMSVFHFLYLTGPYPLDVGNVYFAFLLYVIALCMIYIYIYIYISVCVCVWVIVHFVWWTLMVMWAILSSHECSWPSRVGMCRRQLL